jgi:hypothetical protein
MPPSPAFPLQIRPALPWSWGATEAERSAPWPCDDLLEAPEDAYLRAVDVAAPASLAFRWLCQLRVAPYSYDALDNGFRRSPRRLTAGLDRLEVGQRVMGIFELVAFTPGRDLTLLLRDPGARAWFGDVAGTYAALPAGDGRCRLVCKLVMRYPRGPRRLMRLVLPWGDLVMMRKQLRTLRALAERDARA